jgi:microcystin-dependent protein
MESRAGAWRTLEAVAAELQLSPEAVKQLVAKGALAAVELDGTLRFHPSVVERAARRAERGAWLRRWRGRTLAAAAVAAATLAGVIAVAASGPGVGEVPSQIPYRGYLDKDGVPVTNPAVSMQFELCTASAGANCFWSETQVVSVQDGNFSVALGSQNAIDAQRFPRAPVYVAVTVDGQALQGRQRLYSVPYAHYAGSSSTVPAGTVVAYAGAATESPPEGWLFCNGDGYNPDQYPALQAAIGVYYGTDPNRNYWPRTPDYRGRFLRGLDSGAGIDPRRALGSVQDWTTGLPRSYGFTTGGESNAHTHNYVDTWYSEANCGTGTLEGSQRTDYDNSKCQTGEVTAANNQGHTHAVTGGGDPETRPTNVSVRWIIKAVY